MPSVHPISALFSPVRKSCIIQKNHKPYMNRHYIPVKWPPRTQRKLQTAACPQVWYSHVPYPHMMHFHSPGCPELPLLQASLLSSWNPSQASHPESSWWQATEHTSHTGNTKGSLSTQHWYSIFFLFLQLKSTLDKECEGSSSKS